MSTITAPIPTYEEAMAQVKALTDKGIPDSVKQKAQAAMAEELAKSETAQNLLDEVKKLADSAIKIDQAFNRVKIDLGTVDQNDFKDKDGKPIAKLQPTWIGFQQRFIKLLWDSRTTATKTEAYIKDFLEVILPIVEDVKPGDAAALADAIAELNAFINRKDPNEGVLNSDEANQEAIGHSQAFTDLRRDINAFRDSFDTFAEAQGQKLDANILRVQGDIDKLNAEIKQYETVVSGMGIALGVTVFATGVGAVAAAGSVAALAALGPAGPLVAVAVLIVGIAAALSELGTLIAYLVKLNDAKSEKNDKQNELKNLQSQLETLKRLQATLKAQNEDIDDICGRLDQFAAIWALVAHDAQMITEELQSASGSVSAAGFNHRIEILKNSYTALQAGLKEYATMVDNSGVPQPSA